jgi:hypothetical protein
MDYLNKRFNDLIAKKLGIDPKIINGDYIHKVRERDIYPNARFHREFPDLLSFTRKELDELGDAINGIMSIA